MGNANTGISPPNSDGKPLFCGWEPLRLSGCFSAVPCIHLAGFWDGSDGGGGGAGAGGYGTACMALCGLFSWAGRGARWASRAARERSGMSDWISVRVLRRAPLEFAVSQGRSGAGRPALFRGFLEEHTSKCIPLKLLCGERDVCGMNIACWATCCPLKQFQKPVQRESLDLFRIVTCLLADCLVWSSLGRHIQSDSGSQNKELIFKLYLHKGRDEQIISTEVFCMNKRLQVTIREIFGASFHWLKTSLFRFTEWYLTISFCPGAVRASVWC